MFMFSKLQGQVITHTGSGVSMDLNPSFAIYWFWDIKQRNESHFMEPQI